MRRAWVIAGFGTGAVVVLAVALALAASTPHSRLLATPPPMADPVAAVDAHLEAPSWAGSRANPAWSAGVAAATGVPARVIAAYADAVVTQQVMDPECHLGWSTIAAIGFVESRHGTHGGATVRDDGYVSPGILGPVLDGTVYDAIPDTDGGVYDGNTTGDRAIGPMQFIPSTWTMWGMDGDINGVIDPHDLDDAAFATSLYLCNAGDLSDPDTWRAAIASYNSAPSYLIAVAEKANEYAAAVRNATPTPDPEVTPEG